MFLRHSIGRAIVLAAMLMAGLAGEVWAQSGPPPLDRARVNILVRTTLVALNHANLTGNYTVLRDLGAPGFRAANDAARLGAIFARLREQKLDIAPLVLFEPEFTREPAINEQGLLQITGIYRTRPLHVQFELAFQAINRQWRLFAVSVAPLPAPARAAPKPGPGVGALGRHPARKPPPVPKAPETQ